MLNPRKIINWCDTIFLTFISISPIFPIFPILDIIPKEQVVDIGRQARMECIVETEEGDDSGRHVITWMKDGQPLPNRTRIIISGRTLQIFVLQRDDYGKKEY